MMMIIAYSFYIPTNPPPFLTQHLASWATQERHRSQQVATTSLAVGSVGGLLGGFLLGCATAPLWAVPAVAVSGACVGGVITHNVVAKVTDSLHSQRMMSERVAAATATAESRQDVIQVDVDSSSSGSDDDDDDDDEGGQTLLGDSNLSEKSAVTATSTV